MSLNKHEQGLLDLAKERQQQFKEDDFTSWLLGFYKTRSDISDKLKQEFKKLRENNSGGT